MKIQSNVRLAQFVAALAIALSLISVVVWLRTAGAAVTFGDWFDVAGFSVAVTLVLAPLGALILTRQPGNMVGWLLLIGALGAALPAAYLFELIPPPTAVTPLLLLGLVLNAMSWIPPIFALFLIPAYFPTGRLLSPRWRWLPWLAISNTLLFGTLILFLSDLQADDGSWGPLSNPIGFIPQTWLDEKFMPIWLVLLLALLGGSVLSLYVRYRNAGRVERQQIKWLLLAGAQFVVVYAFFFINSETEQSGSWASFLFLPSALAIPVAVAIAILRYRLYDIDIIIRKTLVYALITGLLALVYFGLVVLLQSVLESVSGEQSPIAIVISTLVIAALFAPLRTRVQGVIDRRFYRKKYDAQQVLAQFAQTARDEMDMEALTAELVRVVQETMQPEQASLWLKESKH